MQSEPARSDVRRVEGALHPTEMIERGARPNGRFCTIGAEPESAPGGDRLCGRQAGFVGDGQHRGLPAGRRSVIVWASPREESASASRRC